MPRLIIAPEARQDLRAIRDYIAKDDPNAAQRLVMRLRDMARLLSGAPAIGRARPEVGSGMRSFVVNRYVLLYRPLTGAAGIALIRVLHRARDVDTVFAGDED